AATYGSDQRYRARCVRAAGEGSVPAISGTQRKSPAPSGAFLLLAESYRRKGYFVKGVSSGFFSSSLWMRFWARLADSIASPSKRFMVFSAASVAFPPVDSIASWEGLAGVFVESKPLAICSPLRRLRWAAVRWGCRKEPLWYGEETSALCDACIVFMQRSRQRP